MKPWLDIPSPTQRRVASAGATIACRDLGRDNNFNLLRALAALAVLVSHAWPIASGAGTIEPLEHETGYKLGSTAVSVFFAVSGFFICKSFRRRASLADFALARVARIYPGLLVMLLLTVLVLGPVATDLPLGRLVSDRGWWTYLPRNALLRHPQWVLPGVFARNPGGAAINGSLWTLYYEVLCYAGVVLLGLAGLLRRWTFPLVVAGAVAVALLVPQGERAGTAGFASMLFLPFALGAAVHLFADRVPVSGWLAAALVAAAAAASRSPLYPAVHAVALAYGALWFGFACPSLRGYARMGDYSYGIYIYAFPVEQLVAWAVPGCGPWSVVAWSVPPTLALAVLSWHLVERPVLDRRHRLAGMFGQGRSRRAGVGLRQVPDGQMPR